MNAIIDMLAETFLVYWKALGKTWAKLLAVFLPANIILVWVRAQTAMRFDAGDGIPAIALRPERHVSLLINLTLGIWALVIIARAAWQFLAKPSDEADLSDSFAASLGRAFGTVLLLCFLAGAYLFVSLVSIFFFVPKIIGLLGFSVPSAMDDLKILLLVAALAGLFIILTRWMLAVALSALWAEIPFCSHCGRTYDHPKDCESHEFDIFVRKHFIGNAGGTGIAYPAYSTTLLPRDSTRKPTPEEHELIEKSVQKP